MPKEGPAGSEETRWEHCKGCQVCHIVETTLYNDLSYLIIISPKLEIHVVYIHIVRISHKNTIIGLVYNYITMIPINDGIGIIIISNK